MSAGDVRRRTAVLLTTGLLALLVPGLGPATATATATATADEGSATLTVSGRIRSVAVDHRSGSVDQVSVVLPDGTALPVDADRGLPATGTVTGTIDLPPAAGVPTGATVSTRSDRGLAVAQHLAEQGVTSTMQVISTQPTAVAGTPATQSHTVYVAVLMNTRTDAVDAAQSTSQTMVDQATAYWVQQSDQRISSFASSLKPYTSSVMDGAGHCGLDGGTGANQVWNEAAAHFPGVSFTNAGNHLVVLLPTSCTNGTSALGLGSVGSSLSDGGVVLAIGEGDNALPTITHEIGHNLSLDHSNAQECSSSDVSSCVSDEYLDLYDVMGAGTGVGEPVLTALNSVHRADLGLIRPAETQVLQLPGGQPEQDATEVIQPRSDTSGQRTLTIVDPVSGTTYYLDYRSGTGRDANAFYTRGRNVVTHGADELSYGSGITVLSTNADRSSTMWTRTVSSVDHRASWQTGETFTSPTGSVSVTVGVLGAAAIVQVRLQRSGTVTPTPSGSPGQATPALGTLASSTPRIAGRARVGKRLTAVVGTWTSGTGLTYQWLRNGVPIARATGATYRLPKGLMGKRISVRVTGTRAGYTPLVRVSGATSKVKRRG